MIDRTFWNRVSQAWTKKNEGINKKVIEDARKGSGESLEDINRLLDTLANEEEEIDISELWGE